MVSRVAVPSDITPATPQQVQRRDQYKLTHMGLILDPDGTIRAVVNQGAGFFAGLTGGDRIVAINGTAIADLPDGWTTNYTFDSAVLLRISLPDGATRHYLLDPGRTARRCVWPAGPTCWTRRWSALTEAGRILIVEDDADMARALAEACSELGYCPVLETTCAAGLATAKAGHFPLAILDRMMPDGDSIDMLAELRHAGTIGAILMVSALAHAGHRSHG